LRRGPCRQSYDANALREKIQERGALANIPPKANRKWKNCFSPFLNRAEVKEERKAEERRLLQRPDDSPLE
jgi:hypothetical protein